MRAVIYAGDCLDVLPGLADEFVDAVVTDPPYELGFMGRAWDASGIAYNVDLWKQCFRVLKPGGHLLAFGGTRTSHRLTCAIEDAGFEIRDEIAWIYGSGFPKSLNVSKAIDKSAGARREVIGSDEAAHQRGARNTEHYRSEGARGWENASGTRNVYDQERRGEITVPATDDAKRWEGWGTALKPARENIVVARKPLIGTVAANVLAYGTGALNIDACRVPANGEHFGGGANASSGYSGIGGYEGGFVASDAGRWPTNVVLDDVAAAELDEQSGTLKICRPYVRTAAAENEIYGDGAGSREAGLAQPGYGDSGGASRFFPVFRYQAKAPTRERPKVDGVAHATVKPLELMRWLVRLVTPVDGIVLEPFAGSGTTVEACMREGMRCIAIEQESTYHPLIAERMARAGLVAL